MSEMRRRHGGRLRLRHRHGYRPMADSLVTNSWPSNGPPRPALMFRRSIMRTHLLLVGLLTVAAAPAFAQSAANPRLGSGNYNTSGSYGGQNSGISVLGDSTEPGMNVGGSSLGNGNIGTSY